MSRIFFFLFIATYLLLIHQNGINCHQLDAVGHSLNNNNLGFRRSLHGKRMGRRRTRNHQQRRSISSVLVETANCEHIELIDCGDYGDKGMRCMLTATGMPCCICNGRLRLMRRRHKSRVNRARN